MRINYALEFKIWDFLILKYTFSQEARRAGSGGSMSASGSAGPGFDPGGVVNFHLKIFNLGARRGGDVHFLIATSQSWIKLQTLPQYICWEDIQYCW